MKKIVQRSIVGLFGAALLLGGVTQANALINPENGAGPGNPSVRTQNKMGDDKRDVRIDTIKGVMNIDEKTAIEIGTTLRDGTVECMKNKTDAEKSDCIKKLEATVIAKFPQIKDAEQFRKILSVYPYMNGETKAMMKTEFNADGKPVQMDGQIGARGEDKKMDDDKNRGDKMRGFKANFSGRFEMVIKNLEAVHDRLTGLADRIESRTKKLSAEGVDVAASAKLIGSARGELGLARNAIGAAKISFEAEHTAAVNESDADSEETKAMKDMKNRLSKTLANIAEAKTHLKAAHNNLVQAIISIKTVQVENL